MAQYDLNRVLFDLIRKPDRQEILKNLDPFLASYRLDDAERQALLDRNWGRLLALGALPNLVFKYYLWHGLPPGEYGQRAGGGSGTPAGS
jgi:hypothetical protein